MPSVQEQAGSTVEQELVAGLQLQYLRGVRLAWLRWLAAASIPVWLEVHWQFLPGLIAWLAFLVQGGCLAMAACYAALEYRWSRRAALFEPGSSGVVVHTVWREWDEVRSALWYGVALVSLVPWIYVGLVRPLPSSLLAALTATVWTVLLLLAGAESVASLWPFRGAGPNRPGRAPSPPSWVGRAGPHGIVFFQAVP